MTSRPVESRQFVMMLFFLRVVSMVGQTGLGGGGVFSYASIELPQPDWLVPVADEVAALEVVVLVDWAAARLAMAMMRAVVYCIVADVEYVVEKLLYYVRLERSDENLLFQAMVVW